MNKMEKEDLKVIIGGGVNASFLTAIVRTVTTILDLGRSVGTAIRRIQNGNICSI